jgi:hypothetical protein
MWTAQLMQAWRVHPSRQRLAAGPTQVWMSDAPVVDLVNEAEVVGHALYGEQMGRESRGEQR